MHNLNDQDSKINQHFAVCKVLGNNSEQATICVLLHFVSHQIYCPNVLCIS